MTITIGSLFSGIGGFELGLELAIPNAKTIWQCEQDPFCRKVLAKHWPDATIYEDIRKMDTQDVPFVDIMCGGFPCQDISVAGKGAGINGKKSGLWWFMLGCISRLRPSVVVLENVPAITFRGGIDVVGSITELGYDCEWGIIPAGGPKGFGAPHLRKRWFLVGYITHTNRIPTSQANKEIVSNRKGGETRNIIGGRAWGNVTSDSNGSPPREMRNRQKQNKSTEGHKSEVLHKKRETYTKRITTIDRLGITSDPNGERCEERIHTQPNRTKGQHAQSNHGKSGRKYNYWEKFPTQPPVCGRDDGISNRVDRLRALGNAIVPQCSEYIGKLIWEAGLL